VPAVADDQYAKTSNRY
jgi:hypothetical protein